MHAAARSVDYERAVAKPDDDADHPPEEDRAIADEFGGELSQEAREMRNWRSHDFQDEYGISLALLLLVMILPIFMPDEAWTVTLVSAVAALAALIALHSSRVRPWLLRTASAAAGLAVISISATEIKPEDNTRAVFYVAVGFLLLVTPVAILIRIAHHKIITPRTLYGALCVYLLIGLGFSFLYQAFDHFDPSSFPMVDESQRVAFSYYSFITLTTVGYGDITPATDTARSAAMFEAVFGQVFLVVIVARVVSMLGHERAVEPRRVLRHIHREEDDLPEQG